MWLQGFSLQNSSFPNIKCVKDVCPQQYILRRNNRSHDIENQCGYSINQSNLDLSLIPFCEIL